MLQKLKKEINSIDGIYTYGDPNYNNYFLSSGQNTKIPIKLTEIHTKINIILKWTMTNQLNLTLAFMGNNKPRKRKEKGLSTHYSP